MTLFTLHRKRLNNDIPLQNIFSDVQKNIHLEKCKCRSCAYHLTAICCASANGWLFHGLGSLCDSFHTFCHGLGGSAYGICGYKFKADFKLPLQNGRKVLKCMRWHISKKNIYTIYPKIAHMIESHISNPQLKIEIMFIFLITQQ